MHESLENREETTIYIDEVHKYMIDSSLSLVSARLKLYVFYVYNENVL